MQKGRSLTMDKGRKGERGKDQRDIGLAAPEGNRTGRSVFRCSGEQGTWGKAAGRGYRNGFWRKRPHTTTQVGTSCYSEH